MAHKHDDDLMDALFLQARDEAPDQDLMTRVLADATDVQADALAQPAITTAPTRGGWLTGIVNAIGGWSSVSGITAAGVMGLAVGLYAPEAVAGLLESDTISLGFGTYDVMPDIGDLWTEDGDV